MVLEISVILVHSVVDVKKTFVTLVTHKIECVWWALLVVQF